MLAQISHRSRSLARGARALARRSAPYVLATLALVAVTAVAVHAQTPTEKSLDQIITAGRNWLIVKGVVLVGAAIIAFKSLSSASGDRQGMSDMAKAFISVCLGLAAVSIINLAQSWMQ